MNEYLIPKIPVPLVCHTVQGESIPGEIFLDMILTEGYSIDQVLEFFNARLPFFPIRTASMPRPILLRKNSVVRVDIPQLSASFAERTSGFAISREATITMETLGPVRGTFVLDLPQEYTRILDLINLDPVFFPAMIQESFVILNAHHIYKIEE